MRSALSTRARVRSFFQAVPYNTGGGTPLPLVGTGAAAAAAAVEAVDEAQAAFVVSSETAALSTCMALGGPIAARVGHERGLQAGGIPSHGHRLQGP